MNRTESAMNETNETNETLAEEVESTPAVTDRRTSRRGMLRAALKVAAVGVAGVAGAELVGTQSASANSDTNFVASGGSGNAFETATNSNYSIGLSCVGSDHGVIAFSPSIAGYFVQTSTSSTSLAIFAYTYGSGDCVSAYSAGGVGVHGSSRTGTGVYGDSSSGSGVLGHSSSGPGVSASSNSGNGLYAFSFSGPGVYANSHDTNAVAAVSTRSNGVQGQSSSPGASGVYGENLSGGYGVAGRANGLPAVFGQNTGSGYGGWFGSGTGSQLRLEPSGASTPPTSGKTGDLFVDAGGNLWFCKGGTWIKIV